MGRRVAIVGTAVLLFLATAAPAAAAPREIGDTCGGAPPAGFVDVGANNPHGPRIDCILHLGITTGVTATTYEPESFLARGQLASFLDRTLRAAGHPLPAASADWFDDDNGSVHEGPINRLAGAGILLAPDRTVGLDDPVSRSEMAKLTVAALIWGGAVDDAGEPPDFYPDDDGDPNERQINQLSELGVVTGKVDGTFAADELLRRDQMATFLARAVDALRNAGDPDGGDPDDGDPDDGDPDGGDPAGCTIHAPDARFDPFYTQQCDVMGIAIVGSDNVDPAALVEAAKVVSGMLSESLEVQAALAGSDFYLILLGEEEGQTTPPEYWRLRDDPNTDWDARARGVADPGYASAGEENVLCRATDRYLGESILIHEFSHSILMTGLGAAGPEFVSRVEAAYASAMASGLWANTYAATNYHEYWAEGVQSWFDANYEPPQGPDGIHNLVDTREELAAYDPALHALVAEVFGAGWRYSCP